MRVNECRRGRDRAAEIRLIRLLLIVAVVVSATIAWLPPAAQAQVAFGPPEQYGAGSGPSAMAVADFNADADPDLAVANAESDDVSILLGSAGGSFNGPVNIAVGDMPSSIAVVDFNADSDPDLVIANYFSDDVSILLGGAGGSFTGPTSIGFGSSEGNNPWTVAVGDFNADSDPDLAVARYLSGIAILLGGDGGTFGTPIELETGLAPGFAPWIHAANLNRDSDPDLVTATSPYAEGSVLLGGPGASFHAPTIFRTGATSGYSVIGNFNRDQRPDLAVSTSTGVAVSLGDGSGGFRRPVMSLSSFRGSLAVGNFDHNSHSDIAIAGVDNEIEAGISILLGRNQGRFEQAASFFTGGTGDIGVSLIATGDFDGNSRDDLATANYSSSSVSIRLR